MRGNGRRRCCGARSHVRERDGAVCSGCGDSRVSYTATQIMRIPPYGMQEVLAMTVRLVGGETRDVCCTFVLPRRTGSGCTPAFAQILSMDGAPTTVIVSKPTSEEVTISEGEEVASMAYEPPAGSDAIWVGDLSMLVCGTPSPARS